MLRLLPPLVITESEIDFGVQAIARAIKETPGRKMDRAAAVDLVHGLVAHPVAVATGGGRPRRGS